MLFSYESENLIYEIRTMEDAALILNFYESNRGIFEPYEPDRAPNFYTLDYQTKLAKFEYDNFLHGKSARYWISRKAQPNIIIGSVNFNNIVRGSFMSCNIGYKIHKDHQRLGYATEAVNTLTKCFMADNLLHRVEAYIHPNNTPSIALAEKCGFTYEGVAREFVKMKGVWVDHLRYTFFSNDSTENHP